MAATVPSVHKLSVGDIDRKVDMSLDDIIKMSKQKKQRRSQPKNNDNRRATAYLRRDANQRREALQKAVSSRSSALRQVRLAEARSRDGGFKFAPTKAMAQRALSTNVTNLAMKRWNRKPFPPTSRPMQPAVQSFKVSIRRHMNKPSGNKRFLGTAPLTAGATKSRLTISGQPWNINKVTNVVRMQTLDSRFASLREERQLQSQYRPLVQRRR